MLWNPAPLHVGDAMDSCSYGLKPTLLQLFLHKWVNQSTWSQGRNQANWSVSSEQVLTWWPRRNVINQSHNNALVVQCSVSKLMFVVYLQFSELIFKVHNLDARSRSKLGWVFFLIILWIKFYERMHSAGCQESNTLFFSQDRLAVLACLLSWKCNSFLKAEKHPRGTGYPNTCAVERRRVAGDVLPASRVKRSLLLINSTFCFRAVEHQQLFYVHETRCLKQVSSINSTLLSPVAPQPHQTAFIWHLGGLCGWVWLSLWALGFSTCIFFCLCELCKYSWFKVSPSEGCLLQDFWLWK